MRRGRDETLTWWRVACCAVLGAARARSACTDTQPWLWLGTRSHTHNRSPAPDGRPHLEEEEGESQGVSRAEKLSQTSTVQKGALFCIS